MSLSVSQQCQACVRPLRSIITTVTNDGQTACQPIFEEANDHLERFSLWVGNIGALHSPESPLSLESRLSGENDILNHIKTLLDDLAEVTEELLETVAERDTQGSFAAVDAVSEESDEGQLELHEEIRACIRRLFRITRLIRQASTTDPFTKALSRGRYSFNNQFDIAHVGEKYPKLAADDFAWLRKRLGQAITMRRQYLSYIRDHRGKLEVELGFEEPFTALVSGSQTPIQNPTVTQPISESPSRPSTFFTKASSLQQGQISAEMLLKTEESDPEEDSRSYTTVSRTIDEDVDAIVDRIPKLHELQRELNKQFECPFCYQVKKFKTEKTWKRHVYSDLRSYVCTSPKCDGLYFADINEWFSHEMEKHRVNYACPLCQNRTFEHEDHYVSHVRRQHPELLKNGGVQLVLDIAQRPAEQIPAQDCPCCFDWVHRVKHRAGLASNTPNDTVCVTPLVFKRHLASHLEQLALFALPIRSSAEADIDSDVAIEASPEDGSRASNSPMPAFDSPERSIRSSESERRRSLPSGTESDVNVPDHLDNVSLHTASTRGDTATVKLLLENGVDPNAIVNDYGSVLEAASLQGHLKIVKLLLEFGADVNAVGYGHSSALQAASVFGHLEIVKLLLEFGADVNAVGYGYGSALEFASANGNLGVVKLLLQHGADVNGKGDHYSSALAAAVVGGNHEIMKVLLENGATIKAEDDSYGKALQAAAAEGYVESVRLLLKVGVESDEGNSDFASALSVALQRGQKEVIQTFLEHPGMLKTMDSLAMELHQQAAYDEAETIYRHAVAASQKMLGGEHLDTLKRFGKLASTLQAQERLQEAESICRLILGSYRKIFGPDSPNTLASASHLATILESQNNFKEAQVICQESLETYTKKFGQDHERRPRASDDPNSLRDVDETDKSARSMKGRIKRPKPHISKTVRFSKPLATQTQPVVEPDSESDDDEDILDYFNMEIEKTEAELSKLQLPGRPREVVARFASMSHGAMVKILKETDGLEKMVGKMPEGLKIPSAERKAQSPNRLDASLDGTRAPEKSAKTKEESTERDEAMAESRLANLELKPVLTP